MLGVSIAILGGVWFAWVRSELARKRHDQQEPPGRKPPNREPPSRKPPSREPPLSADEEKGSAHEAQKALAVEEPVVGGKEQEVPSRASDRAY